MAEGAYTDFGGIAASVDARRRASDIDAALMQRVAVDDEAAIAELYDRFGPLVYKMALQGTSSRVEAEDAVQEVFVRLWRTASKFDPAKASLVTWVMLLTRRHLVDRLRRRKARVRTSSMHGQATGEGRSAYDILPGEGAEASLRRLEEDERFSDLMKKIQSLPELQQTVVVRSYLGGQTLRQIADELGAPLGTVKSALSRALVRLRERAGEDER